MQRTHHDDDHAQNQQSRARALGFRKAARKAGITVESQLWTVGSCNGVLVLSGDERKMHRCLADLVALGHVRTETMRALDAEEFKGVIG